jgi:hypothetical protein
VNAVSDSERQNLVIGAVLAAMAIAVLFSRFRMAIPLLIPLLLVSAAIYVFRGSKGLKPQPYTCIYDHCGQHLFTVFDAACNVEELKSFLHEFEAAIREHENRRHSEPSGG